MTTTFPSLYGFSLSHPEYDSFRYSGKVVLYDRHLQQETRVAPGRVMTMTYQEEEFLARVTKVIRWSERADVTIERA